MRTRTALGMAVLLGAATASFAQTGGQPGPGTPAAPAAAPSPTAGTAAPAAAPGVAQPPAMPPVIPKGVETPPGYVIGPDDVLEIVFWREKDMSAAVTVRPDGKISLPLVNDIHASGMTPEELRASITEAAGKFVEEPTVTVVVKAINSRKVYVMGQVGKQGPYPLSGPTTIVQMLATAGGVLEYAKTDQIKVMRTEGGKTVTHRFNYKDFMKGRSLAQNIELKPGDTILVP